jgi:hypothetical protein
MGRRRRKEGRRGSLMTTCPSHATSAGKQHIARFSKIILDAFSGTAELL